jgi:spoIIIJ-associated protein
MEPKIEIIKKIIEDILSKLNVNAEVEYIEGAEGTRFLIRTREGALLIGENGQNLLALNHIVKKIIETISKKTNEEKFSFSLDVNDYQAKKIEDLKNLARLNAQRVRYFKKEIAMKPMTSFERRIVHSFLTEYPDIMTESTGEEPNRRVVIKPYS